MPLFLSFLKSLNKTFLTKDAKNLALQLGGRHLHGLVTAARTISQSHQQISNRISYHSFLFYTRELMLTPLGGITNLTYAPQESLP